MNAIRSEIDRARTDLEDALGDLEASAQKLTPAHWKAKAKEAFRRNPGRILAGAAAFGFLLGRRR